MGAGGGGVAGGGNLLIHIYCSEIACKYSPDNTADVKSARTMLSEHTLLKDISVFH